MARKGWGDHPLFMGEHLTFPSEHLGEGGMLRAVTRAREMDFAVTLIKFGLRGDHLF